MTIDRFYGKKLTNKHSQTVAALKKKVAELKRDKAALSQDNAELRNALLAKDEQMAELQRKMETQADQASTHKKDMDAVARLEQKVAALSQQNELLAEELRASKQQQQTVGNLTMDDLKLEIELHATAAESCRAEAYEAWILQRRLQKTQDECARREKARSADWAKHTEELAEAKADSDAFEQMLVVLIQEKKEMETRYKRKLHNKRVQIKGMAQDAVELHTQLVTLELELEKRQSEETSSVSSPTTVSSWSSTGTTAEVVPAQTRIRQREEEASDSDGIVPKRRRMDSNAIAFDNLRLVR
ncbi:hypothetical protein PRIC1_006727 [Phytophthora ramorum]